MNNEQLILNLQEWGLLPSTLKCDLCTGNMALHKYTSSSLGYRWVCNNPKSSAMTRKKRQICRATRSMRQGTFFAASKLPISTTLAFVSLWAKNASLKQIQEELELAPHSAVNWSAYWQEVLVESYLTTNRARLGGVQQIVEVEESQFGKGKKHRGRKVEGQWVFGGYERETGRIFMEIVAENSNTALIPVIQRWIEPESIIISDCWRPSDSGGVKGARNFKMNSIKFKDQDACRDPVEAAWKRAKVAVLSGRQKTHSPGQLAKYLFIRSCRVRDIDPVEEFFRMAGCVYNPNNAGCKAEVVCEENKRG